MRPEKVLPVLEAMSDDVPERSWLCEAARFGIEHRRLSRLLRAERASSGRAHCRSCRELIAKGEWRFALQMFEEGRPTSIGTIHVGCAAAYFGTADVLSRAQRLTPDLNEADLADLATHLAEQRPGLAKTQGADADDVAETEVSRG